MCFVGHYVPMKVAIGAVRGLYVFLHEAKNQVIYRDFKASKYTSRFRIQRQAIILWIG